MTLTDFSSSTTHDASLSDFAFTAPTVHHEDAVLVERLVNGEPGAWRELSERFDRLIYRCITKVTARFGAKIGPEDVREIYATLLLQLVSNDMHKLRSFDPSRGNRLSTWIGMLATNASYDYLRAMKREGQRAPLFEVESLSCDLPDPFEQCDRKQRVELLVEQLEELSAKDRELVSLYFGEGLSPNEVAERMGISVKTVYSKKHKLTARLETMLAQKAA